MESKKDRAYAIIAGVCFILLGVFEVVQMFFEHFVSFIMTPLSAIVLGIFWIIKRRGLAFQIILCIFCVCFGWWSFTQFFGLLREFIININVGFMGNWLLQAIADFALFLTTLLLLLITVFSYRGGKPLILPKARSKVLLFGAIFTTILNLPWIVYNVVFFDFVSTLNGVLPACALFTSCLWLKDCNTPIFQKKAPTPAAAPLAGRAERLQQYKDLLDAGVLTQAEFDAKKAEILHL